MPPSDGQSPSPIRDASADTVPEISVDEPRTAVLMAADDLFYRNGIGAVTMADIRDRSGVAFRRLYSLFPRKTDLVTGWLTHRHETWMVSFGRGIDERLANGAAPADAIFGSLQAWLVDTGFRGCGFINTLAETGEVNDEHRAIVRAHKLALVDVLGGYTHDPEALAVIVDGAIVQASVFASTAPVDAARRAARPLLEPTSPARAPTTTNRSN